MTGFARNRVAVVGYAQSPIVKSFGRPLGAVAVDTARAAIADAGLPDGTFAHLLAAGIEVGEALVDAPAIQAVGFTGSTAGGRAIMDRAARRPQPIPVYAEMGSINPIVVTEAALAARGDAIAEGLVASVATFGGQLCTKPGVVFVPAGEEHRFVDVEEDLTVFVVFGPAEYSRAPEG